MSRTKKCSPVGLSVSWHGRCPRAAACGSYQYDDHELKNFLEKVGGVLLVEVPAATGEVLHALGVLGQDSADPVVRRTRAFLVKTQRADGSWLVPSENLRKDGRKESTEPIYGYWAAGWAVIGILNTLPR
jgi:hypothetical protein